LPLGCSITLLLVDPFPPIHRSIPSRCHPSISSLATCFTFIAKFTALLASKNLHPSSIEVGPLSLPSSFSKFSISWTMPCTLVVLKLWHRIQRWAFFRYAFFTNYSAFMNEGFCGCKKRALRICGWWCRIYEGTNGDRYHQLGKCTYLCDSVFGFCGCFWMSLVFTLHSSHLGLAFGNWFSLLIIVHHYCCSSLLVVHARHPALLTRPPKIGTCWPSWSLRLHICVWLICSFMLYIF
jgi:hypothetical protein